MRKIQQEENDWARDQEVLQNYKEGLEKEIADLKQQIADAKTRKHGIDKESADKSAERDAMPRQGRDHHPRPPLEESPSKSASRSSPNRWPRRAESRPGRRGPQTRPRAARRQARRRRHPPPPQRHQPVPRPRNSNKPSTVRPDLFKDGNGREFNMKVIYFGLSIAYAVNDDGPSRSSAAQADSGWKFDERPDLAAEIVQTHRRHHRRSDATFISLPFAKP
jgi:hypothetical protein